MLADRKRSGALCRLVKLQRPPPEIRILAPTLSAWSSNRTFLPRWPAVSAHISPAAPAPRMTTSNACVAVVIRLRSAFGQKRDARSYLHKRALIDNPSTSASCGAPTSRRGWLKWTLRNFDFAVSGENNPKRLLRLIDIPGQGNLCGPVCRNNRLPVEIEVLDHNVIAFDV